jgi:hypothetical protein
VRKGSLTFEKMCDMIPIMKQQSNSHKAESLLQLFDFPKKQNGFGAKKDILTFPQLAMELGNATIMANYGNNRDIFFFNEGLQKVRKLFIDGSDMIYKSGKFDEISMIETPNDFLQKTAIAYLNCAFPASLIGALEKDSKALQPVLIKRFKIDMDKFVNEQYADQVQIVACYRAMLLSIQKKKILTTESFPNIEDAQLLLKNLREEYLDSLEVDNNSN